MVYNHAQIEKKWREYWQANPPEAEGREKFYCLDMFPYPSATGLHVGHWRGYVLSDVMARCKILQGYDVLHPMGWDAFGLPAENFAIKIGAHPKTSTEQNIAAFKRQLHDIAAVYDWKREVNTTDPCFYKWTQWIFLKMFERGLAYEKEMPVNWCPSCKCVLANEEAAGGECERCKTPVTKKMQRQWMLKITAYADRLLDDLKQLDWPEKVKKMQADWIGKSYGAKVEFQAEDMSISVFTTRPDTLYGATFIAIAPESPLLGRLAMPQQRAAVEEYIRVSSAKSAIERQAGKEKTGVFTGSFAENPLSGKKIPIWVADYILADYGTGVVMCVPAHDQRDYEFAVKFKLPIINVIQGGNHQESKAYLGDGVLVNSPRFNGMRVEQAKEAAISYLEEIGRGSRNTNYKLRDWVFSRQRYWGEPIPVVHCETCGIVGVPQEQLPVMLPDVESYEPTGTGESPLALIDSWVNTTCPSCAGKAKRETNTMPQWAGSSWYFLRYADPQNNYELASKDALTKWLPVDYYVGGIEHAVLHLLYSRFYTKFLYDIGLIEFTEPFKKLFNQGMLLKNGRKMSKSEGNVVSPDEMIERYGCDSLRMYELFVGPPEDDCEWDDSGIDGVYRFLNRLWKLMGDYIGQHAPPSNESEYLRNKMIHDIQERIKNLSLNTVISAFMEYTNKLGELARKQGGIDKAVFESLVVLLWPFAPHMAEELWQRMGHEGGVARAEWPVYDESKLVRDTIDLAIQVNGKLREVLSVPRELPRDEVLEMARNAVAQRLDNAKIAKEVYVPGKIVNFVFLK